MAKILLGITGGIASYKSCELIRLLGQNRIESKVCLTKNAKEFVTPLTVETLSKNQIISDQHLDSNSQIIHTKYSKEYDLLVVAPATANFIAKLANGICDDALTSLCAARATELLVVPAMNVNMWKNPANQRNIKLLKKDKIHVLGPVNGIQACGDVGNGRMEEPKQIVNKVLELIQLRNSARNNKRILITAGPTIEKIDPVRAITNFSSGKMGFALALEARKVGAYVKLVTGPVNLPDPYGVDITRVQTGVEMHSEVMGICKEMKIDLFIAAAAVADWKAVCKSEKLKKDSNTLSEIKWELNPDIAFNVSTLPQNQRPITVGFAAETEETSKIPDKLEQKRKNKQLDMLIANKVPESFNSDNIEVNFIQKDKPIWSCKGTKNHVAKIILETTQGMMEKSANQSKSS